MLPGPRTLFLILICITLCIPAISALPVQNSTDTGLVTVVMDNNYPPFSFRDANGNLVGISVDMWRLWEQKTGIPVEITGLDWDDALRRMEAGDFDVIDTVFYSEDRARLWDFTPPYSDVDVVIFFNANVTGISGPESLGGFVVGMHKGDSTVADMRKLGITVREYGSYEAVVKAAKEGEIQVFILDKPGGIYYLYREGIAGQFHYTSPIIQGALHRAVKKGDGALLATVNEGFSLISPNEYEALDRKWFGTPVISPDVLRVIIAVSAVIIVIVLLLLVWNRALTRTVAQKTRELNAELEQRRRAEDALKRTAQKLAILNGITFTDIQNAVFSLAGYIELEKCRLPGSELADFRDKQELAVRKVNAALQFAKNYQDLGKMPPAWQDIRQAFLIGISHLDLSGLKREIRIEGVEVYADPILEKVFFILADNVIRHSGAATQVTLSCKEVPEGLLIIFDDNGCGIPSAAKEQIFARRTEEKSGMGLFLAREILSITGITIRECGREGEGARFALLVPGGMYRFPSAP